MAQETITVVAHADNRPSRVNPGPREPLVQILIARWGDVNSISFHPSQASEIALAIERAGRAASRGKSTERVFVVKNDDQ